MLLESDITRIILLRMK